MESLGDLLKQKSSLAQHQAAIKRLKLYIKKKYRFDPQIDFYNNQLTIKTFNSAQSTVLQLDLANLNQLVGNFYDIKIKLGRVK